MRKAGAAQLGIVQAQFAVVALDDVQRHGQADALPRVLGIGALAAADDSCALFGRHSGTVVLDPQLRVTRPQPGAHANPAQAQAIGVLQQVAEQFQQRAALHRHAEGRREVPLQAYPLVAIDLVQRVAQGLHQRRQLLAMAYQAALAQAGALQLIAYLLAHALDLAL